MTQSIPARFEQGVFVPGQPPNLSDGQQVTLIVLSELPPQDDVLELASRVYQGLSDDEINEVESIALTRENFFGEL